MKIPFLGARSKLLRRGAPVVGLTLTIVCSGLAVAAAAGQGAGPALSSGGLRSEWLAALGPASRRLPQIDQALEALAPTATGAQVQQVVAPLAGLVAPINALLPASGVKPTTLQALGNPSTTCQGARYNTPATPGVKLAVAGVVYTQGFQLVDNFDNFDVHCTDTWRWHLGPLFRMFSASVGLDATRSNIASLVFIGPGDKVLPFTADGQTVTGINIYAGEPTNITLDTQGVYNLIIESTNSNGGIVDFLDDALTP